VMYGKAGLPIGIVLVMEQEQEHIVTGNKKGNILGNRTERQNGQHTHRSVAIQDR